MIDLISENDGFLVQADNHDVVSVDVDALVADYQTLCLALLILQKVKISISHVQPALPVDEVCWRFRDRRLIINL